jgi:hypothetical protein
MVLIGLSNYNLFSGINSSISDFAPFSPKKFKVLKSLFCPNSAGNAFLAIFSHANFDECLQ